MPAPELQTLLVRDLVAWSQWLLQNAETSPGVWLVMAKKGTTTPTSLSLAQALDEALCYGWINGQAKSRDAATVSQRYTPRTAKSTWSQINQGHVARLEQEGRMQPRGWREVERAKADGRWDAAYASYSTIEPPKDLMAAIGAVPAAYVRWEVLMKRERYEILLRLTCLRTEDGRMKNIARTVERLTRGEALHPQQKGRGVKRAGGLMDAKPVKRAKRRGEEESGAGSRASPVPDALMKKTGRRSERIAVRDSTT